MRTRVSILCVLFLLGTSLRAEEFWEKNEYQHWSERECRKLLENSPWAKRHVLSSVHIDPLQTGSLGPPTAANPTDPTTRGREQNPRMEYQVQFRSALPIRQALVRLAQLTQGYDKMSPEQRQTFDQKMEEFLGKSFADTVIVHVDYGSNVQMYDRDLAQHWQKQTTDLLRNVVFLIGPQGEKVPLLQYVVGEGARREFQFVFPREFEGRPLVGPEDKSLKLEFPHPNIGGQGESRVLIEFNVEKMQLGEEIVY